MDEEKKDEIEVIFGIKIGDKYLTLTEEAAKELYAKLHKMFGEKVNVLNYPWIPYTYTISDPNFKVYTNTLDIKNIGASVGVNSGAIYVGDNPGDVTTTYSLGSSSNFSLT